MTFILTLPTTFYSYMKGSSPASELDLSSLDKTRLASIREILAGRDVKLQNALAQKLTEEKLKPIVEDLILNAPHLLDTCLKVVQLDLASIFGVENVTQRAQDEALFLPKPQPISLPSKLASKIEIQPGLVHKVTHYVIALITQTYRIDPNRPPRNYWSAQSQWMFFRSTIGDIRWIGSALLAYFMTVKKTVAAGLVILGALIGVQCLYRWFQWNKTAQLNPNYFRNLTAEDHPTTLGRPQEMQTLISCLCTPPGERPNIPILVAPPGVGKTQLVEGFAQMVRSGEIPRLKGKEVVTVNTADLAQHGGWEDGEYASRLELMFKELEGKEDQVILFFDEVHNADSAESAGVGRGLILESLKTKLLERNILAILATTEDEYKRHILPHPAFVDRTQLIPLGPLSKEVTKEILQRQFIRFRKHEIEVGPEAIETVLEIAEKRADLKDRANPRKSIDMLQRAVNYVYGWIPYDLKNKTADLEQKIHQDALYLQSLATQIPHWETEGKTHLEQLKHNQKKLETQKARNAAFSALHNSLADLQELQRIYRQRNYTLVHQLAHSPLKKEERAIMEKSLLWVEFIIVPTLQKLIDITLSQFQSDYNEMVPTKVTAEIVKTLFPEV